MDKSAPPGCLRLTLYGLLAAALASLGCVVALRPEGGGATAFLAVWLTAPLAALALLLRTLWRRGKPLLPWCVTAILVAVAGLAILADAIVWHPDAQSAIGVVLAPVFQGIVFILAAPVAWWVARCARH